MVVSVIITLMNDIIRLAKHSAACVLITMPEHYNAISDEKVAKIFALKALGYSHEDVAEGLNIGKNTVARYVRQGRERVEEEGANPFEVYTELVEPLYDINLEVKI